VQDTKPSRRSIVTKPLSAISAVIIAWLGGEALSADDPAPTLSEPQQTAVAHVDRHADQIKSVNRSIWEFAEVGLQEHRSSALLVEMLQQNGFDVETGVSNMPTAFKATYGSGAPVIGILAEYDALPEMSQVVEPHRKPVVEGAPGHACGHSGLGAGALGAALAVKAAMDKHNLPGTIRLYGTPAEETLIGKVYMLLDGQFDDLDVCLHWHPASKNNAQGTSSKAMVSVKFAFRGIPAHSSGSPHRGRSALDAVELMNVGVNYMREHVKEDARMHYVITDGGGQPNVVPPEATVWYFIRADSHDDVEYNFNWIRDIATAASTMTRTQMNMTIDTDCHELIVNKPLTEAIDANLKAIGPPKFSPEEHAFARRIQQPLSEQFNQTFETTLNEDVASPEDTSSGKGSTDVGDVSWRVPTGGLRTACMAEGSPGHSWQNVACIGSSIGEKGILYAAKTLAATAVQLLVDEDLRVAAKTDHEERMKDRKYTTLIPEGQKAPKSIR
jgi:aminobenzoyl-glutamate utilization protein B